MRDLRPLVERNQSNALSQAEAFRDHIYDLFEQAAAERQVEILILKSPPFTSPPWVRVESWLPHRKDSSVTLRSSAEFTLRPRDLYRFPVETDLAISDDKRTRIWRSIIEFEAQDAQKVLDFLLFEKKPRALAFRRCREAPLQLWRPINKPARLGIDPRGIAVRVLWVIGIVTLVVGVYVGVPLLIVGVVLLLVAIILAYINFKRRRHVLSSGKPTQEPRELIRLDSWQTLVRGLGSERDAVRSAIEQQLVGFAEDGFVIANEVVWHWGVDGKEERVQLVARFRRAIAFVHIDRYGDDLYVGWDAHVNCGTWVEQRAGAWYDKKTSELCTIHTIAEGWNVPNEYDVSDANCLLERIHAAVIKVVKLKLAECHIDQDIDFHILREERQGVAGREKPAEGARPAGIRGALMRFRRTG